MYNFNLSLFRSKEIEFVVPPTSFRPTNAAGLTPGVGAAPLFGSQRLSPNYAPNQSQSYNSSRRKVIGSSRRSRSQDGTNDGWGDMPQRSSLSRASKSVRRQFRRFLSASEAREAERSAVICSETRESRSVGRQFKRFLSASNAATDDRKTSTSSHQEASSFKRSLSVRSSRPSPFGSTLSLAGSIYKDSKSPELGRQNRAAPSEDKDSLSDYQGDSDSIDEHASYLEEHYGIKPKHAARSSPDMAEKKLGDSSSGTKKRFL